MLKSIFLQKVPYIIICVMPVPCCIMLFQCLRIRVKIDPFSINSILLSSENKKNRINEAAAVDKRTVPSTLHSVKGIGYDVIGMVKKTPEMFFRYNGEDMSLISVYSKNKKRRGRSRYLLSVMVEVVKDGAIKP